MKVVALLLAMLISLSQPAYKFPEVGGSYGGNQMWYADAQRQQTGCAPVAAANIIAYHTKRNWTKQEYLVLMNDIYSKMIPEKSLMRFTGVSSIEYFAMSTADIAKEYGVEITPCIYGGGDLQGFMQHGLKSSPVVLFLKNGDKMGHVVTVVSCDGNIIEVSNYGKREQIDISHFSQIDVVYFK